MFFFFQKQNEKTRQRPRDAGHLLNDAGHLLDEMGSIAKTIQWMLK